MADATTPLSLYKRLQQLGFRWTEQHLRSHPATFYSAIEDVIGDRLEILSFMMQGDGASLGAFSEYGSAWFLADNDAVRLSLPGSQNWAAGKLARLLIDYGVTDVAHAGKTWQLELGVHAGAAGDDFSVNDYTGGNVVIPISATATPDKFETVEILLGDVTYARGDRIALRAARVAGGTLPPGSPIAILGATLIHQADGSPDDVISTPPDTPAVAPDAPSLDALVAGPESLAATISSAISGADYYELQISTDSGFATVIETRVSSDLSETFSSLDYTATHYVRARSGDSANSLVSAWSTAVSGSPDRLAAPGAPTFTLVTEDQIQVDFPTVSGATRYDIRVGTSSTGDEISAELAPFNDLTEPSKLVTGLSGSTTYYFGCTAKGVATSPESTEATQATDAPAGSSITPSIVVTRSQGVAPFPVVFNAYGTTATSITDPAHQLDYYWTFGDVSAGNWSYGNQVHADVQSRNIAFGPRAAHLFTDPGMYTVTLFVRAPNGDTAQASVQIEVQDPNIIYPGNATVCISEPGGDFVGAPAGALLVSGANFDNAKTYIDNANTRVLFRRGGTFSGSGSVSIGSGNVIGTYGSGSRPIITLSGSSDVFVMDTTSAITGLDMRGNQVSVPTAVSIRDDGSYHVVHDCLFRDFVNIAVMAGEGLQNSQRLQELFLHDCSFQSGDTYCGFVACLDSSIQGNEFKQNASQHSLRMTMCQRTVISHNDFREGSANKTFLAVRGPNFAGANDGNAWDIASLYTEDVIVSDNVFQMTGDGGDTDVPIWCLQFGATNNQKDERHRDIICERNFWYGLPATGPTQAAIHSSGDNVWIRNNVIDMTNFPFSAGIQLDGQGGVTQGPSNCKIVHNTIYMGASTSGLTGIRQDGSSTDLYGNLVYFPNVTGTIIDNDQAAGNSSANTGEIGAETIQTDPDFDGTPGTSDASAYQLTGSSYAAAAGDAVTTTYNFRDFRGQLRHTTTPDVGAFEI